jgi:hypothetical protein
MTPTERQRRYRARRAGKPLPVGRDYVHQVIDAASDDLTWPQDADRPGRWMEFWRKRLRAALDGERAGSAHEPL